MPSILRKLSRCCFSNEEDKPTGAPYCCGGDTEVRAGEDAGEENELVMVLFQIPGLFSICTYYEHYTTMEIAIETYILQWKLHMTTHYIILIP